MAFPNSYSGSIATQIPVKDNDRIQGMLLSAMYHYIKSKDIERLEFTNGTIRFDSRNSLIPFNYSVEIELQEKETYEVKYEFHLIELIKVTILLLIVAAFLSTFSVTAYLWFAAIFGVLFFGFNILFINTQTRRIIKKSLIPFDPSLDQSRELYNKTTFPDNINTCPACEARVSIYDHYCPECGLKLPGKRAKPPSDTTSSTNQSINYQYKKTEKDK